ncbi:MFS general substrate transporter [Epithele typhae]|uniref:MFS general substrate transporter n=1 Tax=Epithele typhae TaxID=378194 RepID=UPI002008DC57|nr:MFS general substrate transporter [Epithele typhae]KAH9944398.1 MFS general substrate transporter [Epithele typhae]
MPTLRNRRPPTERTELRLQAAGVEVIEVIGEDATLLDHRVLPSPARATFIRSLALLCACSLSVGSHYATYILGPLKSRLSREMGTNNTEFSLLISASSLNSTWTPLVGGLLASRLGTTYTSILATGVVFFGQACLLAGNLSDNVRLMALGMFVFGLGVSPLAVVQETIIVRFFKSHGLGVSLALGLVAGKGASFISAFTSYPLSQQFGPHAPFYASTFLTALSFAINIVYLSASKWLIHESGTELEASELHAEAALSGDNISSEAEALKEVAKKRMVYLRDITKLGDVFWAYIGLNVLCGSIWAPFTHLAANVLQHRFDIPEADASITASYLLAGSVILYPVTGMIVDRAKKRNMPMQLLLVSGVLTSACYAWLAAPPKWTRTPIPAVLSFALGHGFAPLLLVVIVPRIVPDKYVSTTLGAHKALEQTGSTIFQTLAGLALDVKNHKTSSVANDGGSRETQHLLNAFVALNVVEILSVVALIRLDRKQKEDVSRRMSALLPRTADNSEDEDAESVKGTSDREYSSEAGEDGASRETRGRGGSLSAHVQRLSTSSAEQNIPLLGSGSQTDTIRGSRYLVDAMVVDEAGETSETTLKRKIYRTKGEVRRGEVFAILSGTLIIFAWGLFMVTAWLRLRSKSEREGGGSGNLIIL